MMSFTILNILRFYCPVEFFFSLLNCAIYCFYSFSSTIEIVFSDEEQL